MSTPATDHYLGGGRDPDDRNGEQAAGEGPIVELPVVVGAPATDRAAGKQRSHVVGAGCDRGGGINPDDRHGREPVVPGGAVAQPAILVVAPAFDGATRQ